MSLEIRFTSEAEETYSAVVSQLQSRWGKSYVDKFENKVSKIFDKISSNPYLYPIDKQFTELRKCVPHKNCYVL